MISRHNFVYLLRPASRSPSASPVSLVARAFSQAIFADKSVECPHEVNIQPKEKPRVEIVEYEDLLKMNEQALASLRRAYIGKHAFGLLGVKNVPGYAQARPDMFKAAASLGLTQPNVR
eukprot:CAMPEP_0172627930 /NCGR_PEP_ID=MMETSP1068-20121228/158920_1 /TAXON_ID=35684 /ORGANISM="Pseudopedinella elastica, Strain CCMP716" /LENGTH=118 /DNA_ID=CAMNT_0013437953 /DNA_START=137 /DNA_END=489 /DNA_ORIENTATION=+